MTNVLAIDLGASSGRGIIFSSDGKKLDYQEIHRFENNCVEIDGELKWNIEYLYREILTSIEICVSKGIHIDSIGIDTWGCDYGVIDLNGDLKEKPYCYRDNRTKDVINNQKLYFCHQLQTVSGISLNEFNTSYQLAAQQKSKPIKEEDTILFTPYLLGYMLTGKLACDVSIASTSAFYTEEGYYLPFLKKLNLSSCNFAPVKEIGSIVGYIKEDIKSKLKIDYDIKVLVTASHDTASAIMTVMNEEDPSPLYLSSGTWSLFGTLLDKPLMNEKVFKANYTNERGFLNKVTFLKNIMGMWIIQECRREWNKVDKKYSFQELQDLAKEENGLKAFINVEDMIFNSPGNMVGRVQKYVFDTQGVALKTIGEITRCIYDSLALEYRYSLDGLKQLTNKEYKTLHIIGGGTQNLLLNQLVADCLDINVEGGCVEATAIGNALSQLYGLGIVKSLKDISSLSKASYTPTYFKPNFKERETWAKAYEKYKSLKG